MKTISVNDILSYDSIRELTYGEYINNEFFTVELRADGVYCIYYNSRIHTTLLGTTKSASECGTIMSSFIWGVFVAQFEDLRRI